MADLACKTCGHRLGSVARGRAGADGFLVARVLRFTDGGAEVKCPKCSAFTAAPIRITATEATPPARRRRMREVPIAGA